MSKPRVAIVILLSALVIAGTMNNTYFVADRKDGLVEALVVYDFLPDKLRNDPPHLTPIDISQNFVARDQLFSIDYAHRKGLIHSGAWICVTDVDGMMLILKRGPDLVTCPNSYSLLGEHTLGREKPIDTVRRAIREELGGSMLKHVKSIVSLMPYPLYYYREYGKENANRIDRQLTYLWVASMNLKGGELPLQLDHEVADHKWIDDKTLQEWFSEAHDKLLKEGSVGTNICHETILSLWETVLEAMKKETNYD